jgi:hypothetical protein
MFKKKSNIQSGIPIVIGLEEEKNHIYTSSIVA